MDNADDSPIHPLQKRSKIVSAIAWMFVVLFVPMSGAWIIGGWVYWFDVLASQQMLIGWIVLGVGALMLIARRRVPGVVCVVLAMVSLYPVFVGRHLMLPGVDLEHKPDGVIRVVSWNINPLNEHWLDGLKRLLDVDADVIIILEASPEMSRSVHHRGALRDELYPYRSYRKWVEGRVSAGIILSRYLMHPLMIDADKSINGYVHYQQMDHPDGSMIVGLLHPASPRDTSRWSIGNAITESQSVIINRVHNENRLPILIGVDLNAGPAQQRAQTLRRAGIKMSKPVFRMGGSFPMNASMPAALRIQLDDIWSLGDVEPIGWEMIELKGSDHQAVIVDFTIVGGSGQ